MSAQTNPSEKRCTRCGEMKPVPGGFYRERKKGQWRVPARCKACQDRLAQEWCAKNRERRREWSKGQYRKHAATRQKSMREYRARRPEVRLAHNAVKCAVIAGELIPQPCEGCGSPKADAHHDDYSRPLEVRWLCRSCHKFHHAELRREGRDPDKEMK